MSLIDVNTLLKEIVPDQSISKNSKKVGVYAGSFKPPTKGHFTVVQKALRDNPDLDELNIFVGTGVRDGIDQSQSMLIWDIYKKYLPFKVNIMPVTKPPIKAVYDYAKDNQNEQVSWIIGAREGNEDDFKDIADRTKASDNYKNLVVRPTITQSGASGTAARNAYKVSQEKLEPLLPKKLNQQEKDDVFNILNRRLTEADHKKGSGKKPKGSGRRLYTDEDPKDTVGIKFSTRQDIVDTLNKKSFKAKSHARQSQIINLIHQRVRAALGRTKDPAKKKKLKSGFEYIKQRKEASKKKTQRLKKQKLKEVLDPKTFDFGPLIDSLTASMENDGLKLKPYPRIRMIHDEEANADNFFGMTAYYDPNNREIVLYTLGRHPKDIMRSYAHELIHVHQHNEDRLHDIKTDNVNADKHLENLEREAYETGNIMFRSWTNKITEKKTKDPFGLNAYARELAQLNEEDLYEKLCKRGKNYIAKRKREGEKHNPFLAGRAVKVCKGQIKGSDGKKKKDFRPKKGKTRSAQGRKPDIVKENTKENFYIYLDMDGVVANFNKRFKDLSGLLPDQFIEKNGKNAFWDLIDVKHKVAFWRGIEIMPGAEKLVNFISQYPYEMLTAPSTKKQSVIGKSLWIKDKVGTLYPSKPKVTYRSAKEKHNVKPELTKFDILIDDKKSTIDRWDAKGGTAIFYQNADQVINDLKKLGL